MSFAGAVAVLLAIFAILGQSWAVYPAVAAAAAWLALWLSKPGALTGALIGLIAFIVGGR